MKSKTLKRVMTFVFAVIGTGFFASCEQEYFEPNINTLPGGGTVTTYKAYTLGSTDPGGKNIYGRVVFYRFSATVTLVQMGLYNTDADKSYTSEIYTGAVADGPTTVSRALGDVSGASGAFVTSKYVVIDDGTFFDELTEYNANVKVKLGASAVAAGDIGSNAAPVAEQD